MKVIIIQSFQSKTPINLSEGMGMKRAFEKLGIETTIWGPGYTTFEEPLHVVSRNCDIIFVIENYNLQWIENLSAFNKPLKIFWSIDSHIILDQHVAFCKRHKINLILHSIDSHQKAFSFVRTLWMPNALDNEVIKPLNEVSKAFNLGFCGSNHYRSPVHYRKAKLITLGKELLGYPTNLQKAWIERSSWINYLLNKYQLKTDENKYGMEMIAAISSYRIHFNRNIANDINFRTFETLGCKTLLFTNKTENLDQLFDIDEHLITYDSKRDFEEKFHYYLNNPSILENVTHAGYKHVLRFHTYFQRVKSIVSHLKNL